MSFCSHCGTKLESEVKFCPSCGESVELDPVNQAQNEESPEKSPPELPDANCQMPTSSTLAERTVSARSGMASSQAATNSMAAPAKKKLSGCALAAIIGGGSSIFLLAVIAIVMAVVFSATAGVNDTLDEWLVKVRASDVEGAYDMTSSGFRANTPLDGFRQYLDSYPVIRNSVDAKYSETTIENEVTTLLGTLINTAGSETRFAAQLIKEGEDWKIQSILLPDAISGSGTAMTDPASSPAANALERHLTLLKQGKLGDAYAMTSQEFKAATSMDAYSQYLSSYPMIADVNSVKYEKGEGNETAVMLYGVISDSRGKSYRFQAQLNQVNGRWLLHVISLPDSPQASEPATSLQDVAFRSVAHPRYYFEYTIPKNWIEEANGSYFLAKPAKGDPYEGRVRMSVRAFPNQETKSPLEIRQALAESLSGLTDMVVDKRTLAMTTLEGDTVQHENEIPEGQYGNFSDIVEYHFKEESIPWKGIEFGVMRHDDKGQFHYLLSVRSEDSCWENLLPVMVPFLGMELDYGMN